MMKKKPITPVSLGEYIKQALMTAVYEEDQSLGRSKCIVGSVPILPGCYTQADSFEEARGNLVEAIELWVTMSIRQSDKLPIINNCTLVLPALKSRQRSQIAIA